MLALRGAPFTLVSPYSPQQCVDRLTTWLANQHLQSFGLAALLSSKPLVGEAQVDRVRIAKNHGADKALRPVFTADLEPYGSGTRLDCRIGLPIPTLAFLTVVVLVCVLAGTCLGVGSFVGERFSASMLLIGAFFLVHPVVLIGYGRYLARGEKEFLERTVLEVLVARRE